MSESGFDPLPKPDELLALHTVTTEMFDTLRAWFAIPARVTLNLEEVDSAISELGDPMLVIAMAMRKLQALHLIAMPGVRTATDLVVTIVQDLDRALIQAPNMRLNHQAASTDWDAALAALDDEAAAIGDPDGREIDDDDPEAARFRELHSRLHEAVHAVVQASDGEIRYFE
jgi:hypothetical protein